MGAISPPPDGDDSGVGASGTRMPADPVPPQPRPLTALAWLSRAWERAPRFVRNVSISLPTFLLDLGLLFVLVRAAHLSYLPATILAFVVANGLSYFLARWLVFEGSQRGLRTGLVYYLLIAGGSALALTGLMWLCVSVLHIDVIVSRVLAASLTGIGGYLLNLLLNFRVSERQGRAGP
jgi:putative flippase GtrA